VADELDAGTEIARLRAYCDELEDAIGELDHEMRRWRDRLEREGWQSHRAAGELKRLGENRDLNHRELKSARQRLAELQEGTGGSEA